MNKEIRELVKVATNQGWNYQPNGGHLHLTPPNGSSAEVQIVASTPSDTRAIANARAQLRNAGVIFPGDPGWETAKKRKKVKPMKVRIRQQELILLGQRVRDKRQTAGMNQTDLAKVILVSGGTVSNLECGKCKPTPANLEKIASFLGFESAEDLILDLAHELATRDQEVSEEKPDAEVVVEPAEVKVKATKTEDELIDEALKILEHLDEHLAAWGEVSKILGQARDLVVDGQNLGVVLSTREVNLILELAKKFGR